MDIIGPIIFQIVMISLNAVFACAEIAVLSVNDAKIAQLKEKGDKRAARLEKIKARPMPMARPLAMSRSECPV